MTLLHLIAKQYVDLAQMHGFQFTIGERITDEIQIDLVESLIQPFERSGKWGKLNRLSNRSSVYRRARQKHLTCTSRWTLARLSIEVPQLHCFSRHGAVSALTTEYDAQFIQVIVIYYWNCIPWSPQKVTYDRLRWSRHGRAFLSYDWVQRNAVLKVHDVEVLTLLPMHKGDDKLSLRASKNPFRSAITREWMTYDIWPAFYTSRVDIWIPYRMS